MAARGETVTIIRPSESAWSTLDDHLRRLAEYGDLLRTLSVHRINVRSRQGAIGIASTVLQPLLLTAIFTGVFSYLVRIPSEGVPYALFAYTALLPWTFFSSAVTMAAGSLVSHPQLITKVYFPREVLPLAAVVAALAGFLLGLVALVALMTWYDVPITVVAWQLLPLAALLSAWSLAVSLLCSAVQVRLRDAGVATPLFVQLVMFASPVIYPLALVPAAWRPWYLLNPMAGIINSFRDVLLRGQAPDPRPLAYAVLVTALVLPLAYAIFKRADATMADLV